MAVVDNFVTNTVNLPFRKEKNFNENCAAADRVVFRILEFLIDTTESI
jgi:hypothetical protein